MTTETRPESFLVKMFADHNWRPTMRDTGTPCEYHAVIRRFAATSESGIVFHGGWTTLREARIFAAGMPGKATASEVEPYTYVPGYGALL